MVAKKKYKRKKLTRAQKDRVNARMKAKRKTWPRTILCNDVRSYSVKAGRRCKKNGVYKKSGKRCTSRKSFTRKAGRRCNSGYRRPRSTRTMGTVGNKAAKQLQQWAAMRRAVNAAAAL